MSGFWENLCWRGASSPKGSVSAEAETSRSGITLERKALRVISLELKFQGATTRHRYEPHVPIVGGSLSWILELDPALKPNSTDIWFSLALAWNVLDPSSRYVDEINLMQALDTSDDGTCSGQTSKIWMRWIFRGAGIVGRGLERHLEL